MCFSCITSRDKPACADPGYARRLNPTGSTSAGATRSGYLRTYVERSDPQKVLDGDLDEFMAASLAARVGEGAKDAA